MYILKVDAKIDFNKTKASEVIGVSREYLTDILNRKKSCSKVLAFCITKYINKNAEIIEYFKKEN